MQLCQQARVSLDIVIVDVAQERGDVMRQMVQLLAFRERDANGWREPVAVCARNSAIQSTARGRRPCRHSQSHPTAMLGWLIGRYGRELNRRSGIGVRECVAIRGA